MTGHRTVADRASVAAAVDAVLDRVAGPREAHPIELRTALAEGADRLVADRVLARPRSRLVAILPLAPADYALDFDGHGSRREFERLLAAAAAVEVTGAGADGTRESAYERAGRAVVDGSEILVALWDEQPSQGRGGTAEIVAYARRAGVAVEVVAVRR